jgi:hypothetical protein
LRWPQPTRMSQAPRRSLVSCGALVALLALPWRF